VRLVTEKVETNQAAGGEAAGRQRRWVVVALVAVGLIAGIGGSWWYNTGYRTRSASDSAIIVTGADSPSFVDQGGHTISMPLANDSPYPVTIHQVQFTDYPGITWDGKNAVIQPGETAYLTMRTPAGCSIDLTPETVPTALAKTSVHVFTHNGHLHGINLSYGGLLMYAVDQCGSPTATATP
jgi:hypothetical protein